MKQFSWKTFLCTLFVTYILVTSFSKAGVRSVGDGGGFAELQLIYFFGNSKPVVQLCLDAKNICKLTAAQKVSWQKLLHHVDQINKNYSVGFVTAGQAGWTVTAGQITIFSPGLYDSQDNEIPEYKIAAYAIAIQLSLMQDIKNDFRQTLFETENALQGLQFQNKKISLVIQGQNIYFHQFKVVLQNKVLTFFAIEDAKNSFLLNKSFQQSDPNLNLNSLNFSQVTASSVGPAGVFFGFANGIDTNGRRFENKKMRLKFTLDRQNQIILDSITIELALK